MRRRLCVCAAGERSRRNRSCRQHCRPGQASPPLPCLPDFHVCFVHVLLYRDLRENVSTFTQAPGGGRGRKQARSDKPAYFGAAHSVFSVQPAAAGRVVAAGASEVLEVVGALEGAREAAGTGGGISS